MDWLIEPFGFAFMQRAAIGVVALGIAGPLTGCWITLRRLTYMADAMSHAVLAGVAAAALLGWSLTGGALGAAIVMALAVAVFVLRVGVAEDAAVGVAAQALFAVGVIVVSVRSDTRVLSDVLFGSPIGLTSADVTIQLGLAGLVTLGTLGLLPLLTATTLDSDHARTLGIRVGRVEAALIVGMAITVVIGLSTVGVLMVITMIVAPPTAAKLLARRLPGMLLWSVGFGVSAGLAGLVVSFRWSWPTGPAVTLVAVAQVVLAAVVARRPLPLRPRVVEVGHP